MALLKALHEDAKRKGVDKMTMGEINAEIAAYREPRRHESSSPASVASPPATEPNTRKLRAPRRLGQPKNLLPPFRPQGAHRHY
jgi:hypothetical protein